VSVLSGTLIRSVDERRPWRTGGSVAGSRTRDARTLQQRLTTTAGVDVELRWDSSGTGWAWHVVWRDGPSTAAMRALAERAGADLPTLKPTDLAWLRHVTPLALALAMVQNVRAGLRPLGDETSVSDLDQRLWASEYPERGTPEDLEFAQALVALTHGRTEEMPGTLRRRDLDELRTAQDPVPDNVVPLHRPLRR
jgi:hypothetical protein